MLKYAVINILNITVEHLDIIVLVKEHFFLLHLEPFLTDFVLQTHQLANVTFVIDRLTFFKVVDEQNSMSISKY